MKRIWLYILLFCLSLPLHASVAVGEGTLIAVSDTLDNFVKKTESKDKKPAKVYKSENYGFDANKYAFQKRYRLPDRVKYSNSSLMSHLYFTVGAGVEAISERSNYNYDPGYLFSIGVGKDIAKNHALSVVFRKAGNKMNGSDVKLERYSLQLNHHFHLTRYFLGYNPGRLIDVSSTLGAGYQHSEVYGRSSGSLFAVLGLRNTIRLSNNIHLAIEPHAAIGNAAYNGMLKGESAKDYNVSYGVDLSLSYTLKNEQGGCLHAGKGYMFFEGGLQAIDTDFDLSETIGQYFALGYGRKISGNLALQGALGYSNCNWSRIKTAADFSAGHPEYTYYSKVQYIFARAEMAVDLLPLIFKRTEGSRFALGLSGGYEYGFQWKYSYDINSLEYLSEQISCRYGGFTGAMQFKWRFSKGKALYLSPRLTLVNFSVPYKEPYDYLKKPYTDKRFNLALGMEFSLDAKSSATANVETDMVNSIFQPSMTLSASFGSNYLFVRGQYDGDAGANKNFSLALDYDFHEYFGARFKLGLINHNSSYISRYVETIDKDKYNYTGLCNMSTDVFAAILAAKVNLTNLLCGYDPYNRMNVSFSMGPILTTQLNVAGEIDKGELKLPGSKVKVLRKKNSDLLLGAHVAFNCGYSVTSRLGIFGEMSINIHNNEYMTGPNLDYNPIRSLNVELGVSYKIK